jgi:capsular polysaccharide biosynthesis protein
MTVDLSHQTNMVHISIRDPDSAYADLLLNALYETTDGLLRQRAKARSDEHIVYIQKQLSSVNYTENRQSLTALLTAELGQQLLINSNAPYVMEKLEPTTHSSSPVSPSIALFIFGGVFLGLLIGFMLSLMVDRLEFRAIRRVRFGNGPSQRLSS